MRILALSNFMAKRRKLYYTPGVVEAGCDEAGRGCLAGPVVAAAVILSPDFKPSKVNDSKLLTAEQREEAAKYIRKKAAAWAIGVVDHAEIDKINILKASIKAMHLAVQQLSIEPEELLIDGNYFYNSYPIPNKCVVHGDALYASIAAASIIAKTHRDALMDQLHEEFPHYGWIHNKGYSTKIHQNAILEHGLSPYHRRTYKRIMDYENSLFPEYAVTEIHERLPEIVEL